MVSTHLIYTYKIVKSFVAWGKFEVEIRRNGLHYGVLRDRYGNVRILSTRASARKAITREKRHQYH